MLAALQKSPTALRYAAPELHADADVRAVYGAWMRRAGAGPSD